MDKNNLEKLVKKSNREVYNDISPEDYDKNESIFNELRRTSCERALRNCAEKSGDDAHLDLGTGTGNILRISQAIFKRIFAIDISENILVKIKERYPFAKFVASDAENLPFKDASFNCVSANALLHHLVSHERLFIEIHRVLKAGGSIYTDHDPNYFFNRFYRPLYKFKFMNKHGFGDEKNDLAEYHNVFTPGINPESLAKIMANIGFLDIKIQYHLTDRSEWRGIAKFAFFCLAKLNKIFPFKSLRTHFSITARKR